MRTPITLKIKFKSANLDQFIERYSVDVSRGGIFIRTKKPLAVGSLLKFEFQLQDASALISGEGTVVWTREPDPARPTVAPGMGVRFDALQPASQAVLDTILAEKARRGDPLPESRFNWGGTNTPSGGVRVRSELERHETSLPQASSGGPSLADDFGQESTRVMKDDMVQALANRSRLNDEIKDAAVSSDAQTVIRAMPIPPEAQAEETTVRTVAEPPSSSAAPRDERQRSGTLIIHRPQKARGGVFKWAVALVGVGLLVKVGLGWWAQRTTSAESGAPPAAAEPATATAPTPPPAALGLTVRVTSDPPGATVFVDGAPAANTTPTTLTALNEGQIYDLRLALRGFHEWKTRLKPKAGDHLDIPLVPNEKRVQVSSTPTGADVLLDGKRLGKTPFTIHQLDLSRSHALDIRRPGFVTQSRNITAGDAFQPSGEEDVLHVAFTLDVDPKHSKKAAPATAPKEQKSEGAPSKPVEHSTAEGKAADTIAQPVVDKPAGEAASDKSVGEPGAPAPRPVESSKAEGAPAESE